MYVTPRRIRNMGLGLDLSAVPDYELREHLEDSQAAVDSFCNVPAVPQPYSFKGGEITDEEHSWRGHENKTARIYPYHTPLKEVTDFRILATESLYVEFNQPGDIFVAKHEGYVEIINFALSKVGLWGASNVPQMGLIDPVSRMSYSYGYDFPVVDDDLYAVDTLSGEESAFPFMAANGYWYEDDIEVKVDDVAVTTGFTLDRNTGLVIFTDEPTGTPTVSYHHKIPREVARASALTFVTLMGEKALVAKGLTGVESIEIEEVRIRRIGSRSGAEKGVSLPAAAQSLLAGYVFLTMR